MTSMGCDFMPLDRQLFRRPLAEALADLLRQKHSTAKQIARGIGVDPATAENLRKGHLSVTTLEKALRAEGRELWKRLGEEIFGETDLEYEERVLAQRIIEAEHAHQNIVRIRSQREALERRAAELDDLRNGAAAQPIGRGHGERRSFDDGLGDQAPEVTAAPSRGGRQ
jgi:transcriptional regulator with XRE-family HTH domain